MIPHTYHLVAGWLLAHGYVLGGMGAALVFGVGWAFHWWVLDVRYWFRRDRAWHAPEPFDAEQFVEVGPPEDWEDLDADAQAAQLIAEWHDELCSGCGKPFSLSQDDGAYCWDCDRYLLEQRREKDVPLDPLAFCRDPKLIEWDTRMQIRRIREIRQELAALRLELAA